MRPGPEQLKQWIERRRINQREAAEELEFGPAGAVTLSFYLSGRRRPGLANALKMERIAGIPAESWSLIEMSDSSERVVEIASKRRR